MRHKCKFPSFRLFSVVQEESWNVILLKKYKISSEFVCYLTSPQITYFSPVLLISSSLSRISTEVLNFLSFLQGWNPPPLFWDNPPPPFLGTPSFWSKFKMLPHSFWEPSKLVHVNCNKHFTMKVLRFVLY